MCEVTPARELLLAFEPASAGRARSFLRQVLCPAHAAHLVGDAELLVTELVANGLRHGAPPLMIRADCRGEAGLAVEVSDGSMTAPQLRVADGLAESGRGLQIVDHLSTSWGVDELPTGKTTWFRLGA